MKSKRCWRRKRLVVDACRYVVRDATQDRLAREAPGAVYAGRARSPKPGPAMCTRDALVARAFRPKLADESHRARLRVEMGRLRSVLRTLAEVKRDQARVCTRRRAMRAKSSCWRGPSKRSMRRCSPSSPTANRGPAPRSALALGASQRTVQRALDALAAAGKSAVVRRRARAPLDDPADARIHDDLVTPGPAAD